MLLQACAVVDHDGAFSGGASHSLAFPLVRGGHTLSTVMRKVAGERRYLALDVLLYIVQQPLDTLIDMHARGVLHLDLVRLRRAGLRTRRTPIQCTGILYGAPPARASCTFCADLAVSRLPASALDAHALTRAVLALCAEGCKSRPGVPM